MELVRPFDQLSRHDLALAGGKGANLGEMARAGLPVPPGFVLLTPAYRAFVDAAGIQPEIERLASPVAAGDAGEADTASAAIRALFDQAPLPPEIATAVTEAYRQLGGGPVAVRSSATAEDLPGASFAGQQETYLNIIGEEAVLEAVRRCWSSLWTPRAISYRAKQEIAPATVALAVVVQQLINADAAGVLFTANPVNGRRDQTVIDGAWGLGEAVVSGQVTPDHWVFDTATGRPIETVIARKTVWTVRQEGGSATVELPPERQSEPCLSEAHLAALVDLGRRVEAHYGAPQDLEWAVADDQLYLVQARPITSLFPMPAPAPPPEAGLRVYACFNTLQGLPEPITPLGIAAFRALGRFALRFAFGLPSPPGSTAPAFKVAAGRIWLDTTGALKHRLLRKGLTGFFTLLDRQTAEAVLYLAGREPEALAPTRKSTGLKPPWPFVFLFFGRFLQTMVAPELAVRRAMANVEREMAAREARAADLQTLDERIHYFEEDAATVLEVIWRIIPVMGSGQACRMLAEKKLTEWLGDASGMKAVLRSLPHNPTTEMDLTLWRVSRQLLAEGAEPAADHPAVKAFLARYGHRAVREIDAGMPRWAEEPQQVLEVLRRFMGHDPGADPERHFQAGAEAAERAVGELVARVRREKGALRAWFLRFLLRRVRLLVGLREYPKFTVVRQIALKRRVMLAAGAQLVAEGRLDRAEDMIYLDPYRIKEGADPRALAAAGGEEYRREMERRAVPRVITSLGETLYGAPVKTEGALVGTAASAGIYEGTVRIVLDPRGAHLEPGEILVAPGTDPAWTPLFLSAGALVMEMGGSMSHGSVVAREYGIPAVVGVPGATHVLKNGQRIRVDGETGQVVPLA